MVPTLQGPDITVGPLERVNLQTENTQPLDTDTYSRTTLEFPCNGETCEAWLYMPKGLAGAKPPVVLMGHGMGGQKVSSTTHLAVTTPAAAEAISTVPVDQP